MVFNATFNNISVIFISLYSVLLVEETKAHRVNHRTSASYTSPRSGFDLTTLVVIISDSTGSCKSNYHMITTAPKY